jgi:ubiquinone/menaquinone biosynthesis C-methylase UbiE
MRYRIQDREIWDGIFHAVPDEWFTAGPSDGMIRCLAFFRERPVRRLLDVGAGVGRWAVYLAQHGVQPIVALDYALNGSRTTAEWGRREKLPIDAVAGDAVAIPFVDRAFDAILAALVLENFDASDKRAAITDMRRVTMAGARAFFLFNPLPTDAETAALGDSDNPTRHCHIEPCTDQEITDLLSDWQTFERGTTREGFRFVRALAI